MEKFTTAVIGGGAAGLVCAARLQGDGIVLFEKLDRVGKKLSATGNGQGNISNAEVENATYFSVADGGATLAKRIIGEYGKDSFVDYIHMLGGLCICDEQGRIYPASRQASSITDLLRREVAAHGVDVRLGTEVRAIKKTEGGFLLTVSSSGEERRCFAENVVLCAGGKAAKNFGTDGAGYVLAKSLGHTVTPVYPSLVQLKADTRWTKTLKGIRAQDCDVRVLVDGDEVLALSGDVIFTEYGVSGDAIFRLSAYIASSLEKDVRLLLDFAPTVDEATLRDFLADKQARLGGEELLCGVVNNQIGRAILRRYGEEGGDVAALVKRFDVRVTGSLGFDYAQVTKGGVPTVEVDENLQSKKVKGLYFAGEILDVDGQCGGFNLQWAYASACKVAAAIDKK